MGKIDVSQWKEFKLTDLFNIKTGAYLSKHQLKLGSIPRVTVSSVNNGIVGSFERCGLSNERLFSNFLSVNFFGNVFYHDSLCSVDMKVHVLEPKNLYSKESMLFLVAVLRRKFVIEGYGTYGNQLSSSKLKMDMVYLPVDASGNPDWQYMDSYIAKRAALAHKYVSELKSTKNQREPLKISGWQEYKLSDLFDPEYTNGDNKPNRLLEDDDGHPLIGATSECFGCVGYYQTDTKVFPAKSLTWDRFGHCFVQPKSFQTMAHGNVMVLKPKVDHSYEALLFVASIINRISQMRDYGYGKTLTLSEFKRSTIKLPALSDGTPDWATMRKQVAHLAALSHRNVTSLDPTELPIFVGNWKEFKVLDLYNPVTIHYNLRRQDVDSVGKTPVYSSTTVNNGVYGYINDDPEFVIDKDHHYVVFGDQTKGLFIPQESFSVIDNIKVLQVDSSRSINQLMFMNSILRKRLPDLGYARYWSVAKRMLIPLPVDLVGNLDWQYMDDYVKFMKLIVVKSLSNFERVGDCFE